MKNFSVSFDIIQSLEQCSQLTSLSLLEARNMSHDPENVINYINIVKSLTIVVPKLTTLKLVSVICEDEEYCMSRSLEILSVCSSLFITLDMSDSYKLPADNACINLISSRCPNLEYLNVSLDNAMFKRVTLQSGGRSLILL
jgi:hypothetical protein